MESAENISHDPLDSTDEVPSPWITDADLDDGAPPPSAVPAPEQRRPIPSIVRRDAVAPVAQPAAERARAAATVRVPTPSFPVPAAKPLARVNVQKPEQKATSTASAPRRVPTATAPVRTPASARVRVPTIAPTRPQVSTFQPSPRPLTWEERPTIPLWSARGTIAPTLPEEPKVEIAPELFSVAPAPKAVEPPIVAVERTRAVKPPSPDVDASAMDLEPPTTTYVALATAAPVDERATRVEPPTAPYGALEAAPAPSVSVALEAAPPTAAPVDQPSTRVEPALPPSEPTPAEESAASSASVEVAPSISTPDAPVSPARKRNAKRHARRPRQPQTSDRDAASASVEASPEPRTFGAGMLSARNVRPKATPLHAPEPVPTTDASPAFGASMLQARKGRPKPESRQALVAVAPAPVDANAAAAPAPEPSPTTDASPAFGASMLQARKGRPKPEPRPALVAVAPAPIDANAAAVPAQEPSPTTDASPAFGAGMLQARKGRPKPELRPAFVALAPAVDANAATPAFGAGVLRAPNSSAKWVALALAVAAIAVVCVAML